MFQFFQQVRNDFKDEKEMEKEAQKYLQNFQEINPKDNRTRLISMTLNWRSKSAANTQLFDLKEWIQSDMKWIENLVENLGEKKINIQEKSVRDLLVPEYFRFLQLCKEQVKYTLTPSIYVDFISKTQKSFAGENCPFSAMLLHDISSASKRSVMSPKDLKESNLLFFGMFQHQMNDLLLKNKLNSFQLPEQRGLRMTILK